MKIPEGHGTRAEILKREVWERPTLSSYPCRQCGNPAVVKPCGARHGTKDEVEVAVYCMTCEIYYMMGEINDRLYTLVNRSGP